MTLDINGKVIRFTMTVETQLLQKTLPIFPLLSNHYPGNIEKIIISGNFDGNGVTTPSIWVRPSKGKDKFFYGGDWNEEIHDGNFYHGWS